MATLAQMRSPLRIIRRCSGVYDTTGLSGEAAGGCSSGLSRLFFPSVSFMLVVAAAVRGPLASRYRCVAGPPAPTEWASAGGLRAI